MMRIPFFISVVAILLISCNQQRTEKKLEAPYFDLKAYFSQEQERLSALSGFDKRVELNGKVEEQSLDTLDWEVELKAFVDADINLPAWYDKYSIDSVFTDNQLFAIQYSAQDTSLRIRKIQIDFSQATPSKIQIERRSNSPLAETFKYLIYEPERGYSILNTQHLRMSEEKEVRVSVRF